MLGIIHFALFFGCALIIEILFRVFRNRKRDLKDSSVAISISEFNQRVKDGE